MAIPPLAYFPYSPAQDTAIDFQFWTCPICTSDDPNAMGGTVAHDRYHGSDIQIDGRRHPIHTVCWIRSVRFDTRCPTCRMQIDASGWIPLAQRGRFTALRLLQLFWRRFECPIVRLNLGAACIAAGLFARKRGLASFGMALQWHVIHRAIQARQFPAKLGREMQGLIRQILLDIDQGSPFLEKFGRLKEMAAEFPEVLAQLDSEEPRRLLVILPMALSSLDRALFSDRFIRWWRTAALLGALYYGPARPALELFSRSLNPLFAVGRVCYRRTNCPVSGSN